MWSRVPSIRTNTSSSSSCSPMSGTCRSSRNRSAPKRKSSSMARAAGHRTRNIKTPRAERECVGSARRRDRATGPMGGGGREALRPAHGHRVGQGWRQRRTLPRSSAAGDRAVRQVRTSLLKTYSLARKGKCIATGAAIGEAISTGDACIIHSAKDIDRFRDGAILVTESTDPDWVPIMKKAAGLITNYGGTTSHAAIVSREFGLPAIVGTLHATEVIKDKQPITLCCAEGERGIRVRRAFSSSRQPKSISPTSRRRRPP